ncbi:MAG TPA: response regulator [Microbacterium sp.]|nr:response regulator [Microbacterium sp.]
MTPGSPTTINSSVRVLTVDDQALFRGVARDVIDATPGFVAVGEAASGVEGLEAVERLSPQLVLLDVRMPGMDGIEVARRLTATHPETVVVLISIEEGIDVPSAAQLDTVPLVRKQDFGPRLLRRLWKEHGRIADPTDAGSRASGGRSG